MKEENISPLLYFTKRQKEEISKSLAKKKLIIDFAMRYGNPSIKNKISKLQEQGCDNLVILVSSICSSNTATVCDEVYRTYENEMATF